MLNLEIIKALKVCENGTECKQCPYFTKSARCVNDLMSDALDLIIQRKVEVEKLKSLCVSKDVIICDQEAKIEALKMDNQQLETDNFNANMNAEHLQEQLDAIIDCQRTEIERLKKLLDEEEKKYMLCAKQYYAIGIEELTERLKDKIINTPSKFSAEKGTFAYLSGSAHRQNEILDYIDNLIKEMTEVEE